VHSCRATLLLLLLLLSFAVTDKELSNHKTDKVHSEHQPLIKLL
jgi:hypothetical protein